MASAARQVPPSILSYCNCCNYFSGVIFCNNGKKSSVNNVPNNIKVSNSSSVCPTPEEFWQSYINLRDSSEKFSEYAKQISTQCANYFKTTSTPDCERLYSLTGLYFANKISNQGVLDVTESLNGKCKTQYNDIQNILSKPNCSYSIREHKCY